MVREATDKELAARETVDFSRSANYCAPKRPVVGSRRASTWEEFDIGASAEARPAVIDFQDLYSQTGPRETACCVRVRSSRLQLI